MTSSTGTCTLTANWDADINYLAATAMQFTAASSIVITWPKPAAITYGTPLGDLQLSAKATNKGVPVKGTYLYSPAAGTVLTAGINQTLSVAFTSADGSTLATATTTITVNKAVPTITWSAPADINYGTALDSTQLNATVCSNLGTTTPLGRYVSLFTGSGGSASRRKPHAFGYLHAKRQDGLHHRQGIGTADGQSKPFEPNVGYT